jgi:hypothetical protein
MTCFGLVADDQVLWRGVTLAYVPFAFGLAWVASLRQRSLHWMAWLSLEGLRKGRVLRSKQLARLRSNAGLLYVTRITKGRYLRSTYLGSRD